MSDPVNLAYAGIDREFASESAATRRRFVQTAAATLGGMGLLSLANAPSAMAANDAQTILNVAATAEVLATIVNTVGAEKLGHPGAGLGRSRSSGVHLDAVTTDNVRAAARHELIHYDTLVAVGGSAITKRIWVPDAVFASPKNLLETLEVGDGIFINAYLIGTTVYAESGNAVLARYAAEFMGVEAVHRGLARQSLGKLGNDRTFQVYDFTEITDAVGLLQGAGFGFGAEGSKPGSFYEYDEVKLRTPDPAGVTDRTVT